MTFTINAWHAAHAAFWGTSILLPTMFEFVHTITVICTKVYLLGLQSITMIEVTCHLSLLKSPLMWYLPRLTCQVSITWSLLNDWISSAIEANIMSYLPLLQISCCVWSEVLLSSSKLFLVLGMGTVVLFFHIACCFFLSFFLLLLLIFYLFFNFKVIMRINVLLIYILPFGVNILFLIFIW